MSAAGVKMKMFREILINITKSGMGTGKEKKTWSEDIRQLLLKKIQYFAPKKPPELRLKPEVSHPC